MSNKISQIDLKNLKGLSAAAAARKLQNEGYNELPSAKPKSLLAIAFEIVKEPMFILLILCGTLYLFLGDLQEALMLLGFVFVIMGITFYQERKTERALEALRDLSSPRALVIRAGEESRIPGREVVTDDIIILSEGDRVPADALVLDCTNLAVDESLLTGESVAVSKVAGVVAEKITQPGGDDLPFVYSGTMIVQGRGIAKVLATGINTELGKIGKSLQSIEEEDTLLKKETAHLVKNLALIGLLLCLIVVVVYGLTRINPANPFESWINGLLTGLTLAMAMLPEEFPVVLTIFLALGAWRISRKNVLTRRSAMVETLGSATVLCTDKTGTLTRNKMMVKRIYANGEYFDIDYKHGKEIPEKFHSLVEYAILACQKDPFDPMEKAINGLGQLKLANTEHLHADWQLIQQYPLSRELLAMSQVWKSPNEKDYEISTKGAPEAIFELCHLSVKQKQELSKNIDELANVGLRVLGVAKASFEASALPSLQHDFDFEFIGLIGLADPVRKTVPAAIQECYRAGIKVVMITGDYPGTAMNIAKEIGLKDPEKYLTGSELNSLSDKELKERVKDINIFSRVVPEQKLRIVNAFKANGEIVAMTGDGVNDAPALKSANIGIAMGGHGTDVARESAGLVLTDDDFSSIVAAVKMGRRIFDNLQKAMTYILSVHIPIAGMSILPIFWPKLPLIFWPVHIVFLELIIDPACSVVFEAEDAEKNIMERSPRKLTEPMFGFKRISVSVMQGLGALAIVAAVYFIGIFLKKSIEEVRALTFSTLVFSNLCLILTNRSWTRTIIETLRIKNSALLAVLCGAIGFLLLTLCVPFLQNLFRFAPLHLIDLAICLSAALISIVWFEIFKFILVYRRNKIRKI